MENWRGNEVAKNKGLERGWLSLVPQTQKGAATEEKKEEKDLFQSKIDEERGDSPIVLLETEFVTPEWGGVGNYTKLWNPEKQSCKRYDKAMRESDLVPDKCILDFLYTPSAHGRSLHLKDRKMRVQELDILGRLFSTDYHHACKLRELHLENMSLGDSEIGKFCQYLGSIPTLETLSLADNHIGDKGVLEICKVLNEEVNFSLTELNMEKNAIEERGCMSLAAVLKNVPNLKILSLNGNAVGDFGVFSLVASMLRNVPSSYDWEPEIPEMPQSCKSVSSDLNTSFSIKKVTRSKRESSFAPPPPPRQRGVLGGGGPSFIIKNCKRRSTIRPPSGGVSFRGGGGGGGGGGEPPPKPKPRLTLTPNLPLPNLSQIENVVGDGNDNDNDNENDFDKERSSTITTPPPPPQSQSQPQSQSRSLPLPLGTPTRISSASDAPPPPKMTLAMVAKLQQNSNKVVVALKKNVTKKERIKLEMQRRKDEGEKEKNQSRLVSKAKRLWRMLRGAVFLLGRYLVIKRGPIKLNILNFGDCGVGYHGIQWLLHGCKFNPNIISLDLSRSAFSENSAIVIAEYLEWCNTLEELCLDHNQMSEEAVRVMCKGLSENIGLASLSLDNCELDAVCLNWIASYCNGWYIDNFCLVRNVSVCNKPATSLSLTKNV